jgi:hypothetical protein
MSAERRILRDRDGMPHILQDITNCTPEFIEGLQQSFMAHGCLDCQNTGNIAAGVVTPLGIVGAMSKCPCCLGAGFHYMMCPT